MVPRQVQLGRPQMASNRPQLEAQLRPLLRPCWASLPLAVVGMDSNGLPRIQDYGDARVQSDGEEHGAKVSGLGGKGITS